MYLLQLFYSCQKINIFTSFAPETKKNLYTFSLGRYYYRSVRARERVCLCVCRVFMMIFMNNWIKCSVGINRGKPCLMMIILKIPRECCFGVDGVVCLKWQGREGARGQCSLYRCVVSTPCCCCWCIRIYISTCTHFSAAAIASDCFHLAKGTKS